MSTPDPSILLARVTGLIARLAAATDVRAEPSQTAAFANLLIEAKDVRSRLNERPPVTNPEDLAAIEALIGTIGKQADTLADWRQAHGIGAAYPG